ncbi:hypothetical protein B484DRAFT_481157 [Ochromonadaceae sp. CCMP2298]|nr:hypothetical protein B484DRAFT_481157 [Ochromonadaceae sp. CCMP2298]
MLTLILPPPMAGVSLGVIGVWFMTSLGNYFVNGLFFTDPNAPTTMPLGTQMLDAYPLAYGDLGAVLTVEEQERARVGRIGSVFMIVGFCCFFAASKMYFPKPETKRELEVARQRTLLATKEVWDPIMWKKANFIFCSFVFGTMLVLVVELSYSDLFGLFIYEIIVMLIIFGEVFKVIFTYQLSDAILIAPLAGAWEFASQLVTFGSPDFLAFLLSYFLGVAIQTFQRVFQKVYTDAVFAGGQFVVDGGISVIKKLVPKYMAKGASIAGLDAKDYRHREVDGVQESDEADSVEPILEYFGDVCSETMILFYFPFFVYLMMQYRLEVQIPILYEIRQSDMMIYLVFQIFVLFAQPFADIFHHSQCELFHGWKIYEYLVYSRYRFLQRECRWKSMENSLDECIEESLRRLDQMCFSSQYYLMLTVQVNGIIYVIFAYECWLRSEYSPFSDSGFFLLAAFLMLTYMVFRWFVMFLAIRLKVWKIKHENTAWHMMQKEEDDLDIPAWDEIKGASTDAYLMNQRITSETFRYKFLNYNRTWLINQLPQLLTPRTMRRSRPYLINQFARIINARRDDISDDSDDGKDKKFGPVALSAPSRNIVRWWLGKAKRRIRLRTIVEPLIKRARGSQCEQCLSRKQLQVEYEIDVDKMSDMYDHTFPGDEEVDQVQWKSFWINNQRYHTICLACLTRRKELEAKEFMKGQVDPSLFDDGKDDYPDWGPVFLSAASKAMLLNWYRKAQGMRAGKRGNKRRNKVVKAISDDEGEDGPVEWLRDMPAVSEATKAMGIKWMRTARSRLQKKHGREAGARESSTQAAEEAGAAGETFRSGRKSKVLRK